MNLIAHSLHGLLCKYDVLVSIVTHSLIPLTFEQVCVKLFNQKQQLKHYGANDILIFAHKVLTTLTSSFPSRGQGHSSSCSRTKGYDRSSLATQSPSTRVLQLFQSRLLQLKEVSYIRQSYFLQLFFLDYMLVCNRLRHFPFQCYHRFNESYADVPHSFVALSIGESRDVSQYPESSAMYHMTLDASILIDLN